MSNLIDEDREEQERQKRLRERLGTQRPVRSISAPEPLVTKQPTPTTATCYRCAEEYVVSRTHQHRCPSGRIYVEQAIKYGMSGSTLVNYIQLILEKNPGSTALQIVSYIKEQHKRVMTIEIVNSVLYSFDNRRFVKTSDYYPRWYRRKS